MYIMIYICKKIDKMNELLRKFLLSDAISKVYLTEKLYGSNSKASIAKFHNKLYNVQGRRFTEDEIERLEKIKREFIKDLL